MNYVVMKKLLNFIVVSFTITFLSGCDMLGLTNISMDSAEANRKVINAFKKNIDMNAYKVIAVSWSELEALSNNIGYLYLDMVASDGMAYSQVIKIGGDHQGPNELQENKTMSRRFQAYNTIYSLSFTDIDPDLIIAQYNSAIDQVPEEYDYRGIGNYRLSIDPVSGEKRAFITINVTEKGSSASVQGENINATYYELVFTGNNDGTATLDE